MYWMDWRRGEYLDTLIGQVPETIPLAAEPCMQQNAQPYCIICTIQHKMRNTFPPEFSSPQE